MAISFAGRASRAGTRSVLEERKEVDKTMSVVLVIALVIAVTLFVIALGWLILVSRNK